MTNRIEHLDAVTPRERSRVPRILSGIGVFGAAVFVVELIARAWPSTAGPLFGGLFLFGLIWLSILVLRTGEKSREFSISPVDRLLIYWSGPLAIALICVMPTLTASHIEERNGTNHFTSVWSQTLFEFLMTAGFVLSWCCLIARQGTHVAPRWLWKVICAPLVVVFGMYALMTPIGCAAARLPLP